MIKETWQIVIEGFVLGLSTGGYCFMTCVPFFMPYILAARRASAFLSFIAGRFLAYVAFAIIAGFIGVYLTGVYKNISAVLLIITSLILMFFSIFNLFPKNPFCRRWIESGRLNSYPFIAGVLLGLNLCPPFLTGMARVIQMGSVWKSVFFFISFFMATTLFLVPMVIPVPFLKGGFFKRLGSYLGILAGIWFLIQGIISCFT